MKKYEGELQAKGLKFAVIVSRFNEFITNKLLDGAVDALLRHGASEENIDVIKVPGSFEIPLVAKKIAKKKSYDAIEQAIERAGTKSGNKGWDAALVAVEMAQLLKKL